MKRKLILFIVLTGITATQVSSQVLITLLLGDALNSDTAAASRFEHYDSAG